MSGLIQAIRGMNDVVPEESQYWQALENIIQQVITSYGYEEIRFPILEKTELFKRSIGEVTDIVEKEMYTFEDRNGDSLTLRPEGTASCVRACIENGLLHNQTQRLWYSGPMFRHERPQKGRYRQFHQFGVEAFGMDGPDIDAELIIMTARMWQALDLKVELQINSLGNNENRQQFRSVLVEYFTGHADQLDEDSQRRLHSNPLRILDSKNPEMQTLIENAPKLQDHLDDESTEHFQALKSLLDAAKIPYVVNSRLVRGLDYYNKTVFEWVTTELGAQGTICAGGRYDGLVSQLGGKPTRAAGFALGVERLVALAKQHLKPDNSPHLYVVVAPQSAMAAALALTESLRTSLPGIRLMCHCGGGSFKSQFKKADKSGAQIALILGEDELINNTVGIKYLREEKDQLTLSQSQLAEELKKQLAL